MIKISHTNNISQSANRQTGFSLIEMLLALTITLVIVGLAFTLLAQSLNRKMHDETQVSALADTNQALSRMSQEISNSGFGLNSNGLVAADSTEEKIRIRANLNALMKQTSSGTVTDADEDVIFQLADNLNGGSSLVRTDVNSGQSAIVATLIDNEDINGDGDGDGLTFIYRDTAGNEVASQNATRVEIVVRITLPQIGQPGSPAYQPEITKQLSSSVVLRNSNLLAY
jgi:prepilin-type N-terminal cleavage/methylation domain-containing protein